MEYKVLYKKSAVKDFRRIPREHVEVIKKSIDGRLKSNPFQGKTLKGRFKGLYRLRISRYRVIYRIVEEKVVVLVLRISHRKDVYRGILR